MLDDEIKRLAASAAMDQSLAGLSAMARMVTTYYSGLIAAGMPEERAFVLTIQTQQLLILRGMQ